MDTSYQCKRSTSTHLPKYPDSVKRRWKVRRDANGDEYIVLNGKGSLAREGLDHIYMISDDHAGAWLTSRQIAAKVQKLKNSVAGLQILQFGDDEAVVSVHVDRLDDLCRAVNARRRRKVGDKERQRLQRINPIAKKKKSPTKSTLRAAKSPKTGRKMG